MSRMPPASGSSGPLLRMATITRRPAGPRCRCARTGRADRPVGPRNLGQRRRGSNGL